MTYEVLYSNSFKHDVKRCQKRGLNLLLLQEVDNPVKVLNEGQVYILRDDKTYTITGQEL